MVQRAEVADGVRRVMTEMEATTGDDGDEIDDVRTHGYLSLEHRALL